jgi:hypothetical protein
LNAFDLSVGELLLHFAMPQEGDYSIPFIFGPAQRLPNLVEDYMASGFVCSQVDGICKRLQVVFEFVESTRVGLRSYQFGTHDQSAYAFSSITTV